MRLRLHPLCLCDSGGMAVLQKREALGFGACAVASSLWGCGFFFGKIALAEMSVGHMVLYRFLFAMRGAGAVAGDASAGA